MPKISYTENCCLNMAFFLVPHFNNSPPDQIAINYEIKSKDITRPNHNILYSIQAQIPVSLIDRPANYHLAYAYYLVSQDSRQYECDLIEKHQLHTLYTLLKPETNDEMRSKGRDKMVFREKIDGVIGFGDNAASFMANGEHMKTLKRDLIENLLPPRLFEFCNANELKESKEDLKTIFAIQETLIVIDTSYQPFFDDHLNQSLALSLESFRQYCPFEEGQKFQLLKLFFIGSRFNLDRSFDYKDLFKCLGSNDEALLNRMAQYFHLNNKNLELEKELLRYLKRGNKYVESVNALVFYYYSLKYNNPIEISCNQEMLKNSFESCYLKPDISLLDFVQYASQYELFAKEPLLGSAILYYFISHSKYDLKAMIQIVRIFPLKSLFMYIGLRLRDQYDRSRNDFRDEQIKKDLRNLKEICIESNFSNLCSYEETLNSVEHLIQYLVNWFSQELIIIFEFIELYNIIDEGLELFKIMHNKPKNMEDAKANNIVIIIGDWIEETITKRDENPKVNPKLALIRLEMIKDLIKSKMLARIKLRIISSLLNGLVEPTTEFLNSCTNFQEIKEMIFNLSESTMRSCFLPILTGRSQAEAYLSLDVHVRQSWKVAFQDLTYLCSKIEWGTIKLSYLEEVEKVFNNDFNAFKNKIKLLFDYFKFPSMEKRIEQIILFDKFRSMTEVAKNIETIRKKLKLESSFTELIDLLQISNRENWDLLNMDEHIKIVVSYLDLFNDPLKLDCLTTFANCLNLVEWLRNNVPSLVQFNELVNLVSTYNEPLPNIDLKELANTLKKAGTAYAPLIYDLKKGATFFEFMSKCETVFLHLEIDKEIPSKFDLLFKKIDLLAEIKYKHIIYLDSDFEESRRLKFVENVDVKND